MAHQIWWQVKFFFSLICLNSFIFNHIPKPKSDFPTGTPTAFVSVHFGAKLMVRISILQSSSQTVTLRVEGEVRGRWVAELDRACEESLSQDVRLILDLAGVSFIDVDGIDLFRALRERHVVLANPSSFIDEQLGGSQ